MRVEEVLNQSPPYVDVDLYASDRPLQSAVAANGGDWLRTSWVSNGATMASPPARG